MKTAFQKMYQQYYSDYEPYDAFLFHAQEELKDCFLEGKDILEIGCGRGAFSLFMVLSGKAQKILVLNESAGFKDVSYEFLTPYFLSTWPSLLVRNRFANFFFSSTFYCYGKN